MKRFIVLISILSLAFSFSVFADTPSDPAPSVPLSDSDIVGEEWVLDDVVILESVSPVTPSDANGFKRVILSLIGNYDPVIVEYRYQNYSSSSYGYLRQVEHDYPWLCSCAIFALVLFLAWVFLRSIFSAIMR